jgi:phosphatidylserine/phosphatidylglycerophosphate/cardiolipin synthase-like enzyme
MRLRRTLVSQTGPLPWRILLVLLFLAMVPVEARGPLERERTMAGLRIYYAPRTNLADIDRALLASARTRVDFAAYVLTDSTIINALADAARRGVKLRIYLDPDQPAMKNPDTTSPFWTLFRQPNVQAKMKMQGNDLMHLKAYQVDGRVLRTGSSNFSFSGARRQDNDLILIESADAVAQFVEHFEHMWKRRGSEVFPSPAIR